MTKPCPGAPPPTRPSFVLPKGTCDSHLHVLGPYSVYPLAEHRAYTSPEAPLGQLVELLDIMTIDRAVIAHVSAHGADMRVTLDALQALGPRARATITLLPEATDSELDRLHDLGVRGVRLSKIFDLEVTKDSIQRVADRIARLGWHISIWPATLEELRNIEAAVAAVPIDIVLDHLAGNAWKPELSLEQEGFALLRALLGSGRVWLKLSGMYRASSNPFPWPELVPFGRKLVEAHTDRLLWASDWPHVGVFTGNMPRSHELIDWLPMIGCDAQALEQILVRNPARLFGFPD
jgi:2-pyrone-4,6-dicarboxylate lactonase